MTVGGHPHQSEPTPGGLTQRIDGLTKRVPIQHTDANTGAEHPFPAMQFRNRVPAAATDGHGFVTPTDARVLVQFHHPHGNRKRGLSHHPRNRPGDSIHRCRDHRVVGIVLNRIKSGNGGQLLGRHPTMKAQANHHRTGIAHARPQGVKG